MTVQIIWYFARICNLRALHFAKLIKGKSCKLKKNANFRRRKIMQAIRLEGREGAARRERRLQVFILNFIFQLFSRLLKSNVLL